MHPYTFFGALVGVPVFFICWIYCVFHYGFILGVLVGWAPSAIVGGLAGAVWPIIALAIAWAVLH